MPWWRRVHALHRRYNRRPMMLPHTIPSRTCANAQQSQVLIWGQALRNIRGTWARRRSGAHEYYRHPQAGPLRYPQSRSYSWCRQRIRGVETNAGASRDLGLGRQRMLLPTLLERMLLQDGARLRRRRHRQQQRRWRWGRQRGGRRGRLQRQRWWRRHRRQGALGTTTSHLLGQPKEDARARAEL